MGHLIDDSNRLKPCPFCGAEAEIITLEGETDDQSIGAQCVQCTSSACGAASGLIYPLMDDVTDLLRERWNKRHNFVLGRQFCLITSGCRITCSASDCLEAGTTRKEK